jgi:hypothetical protein
MQLHIDINGVRLLALLDSSLTHNFVDLEAAARAGAPIRQPLQSPSHRG